MNPNIEEIYQKIGREAITAAPDLGGKLLIYSEIEGGVISSDIFYVNQAGGVTFRFSSEAMRRLLYSFWEQWQQKSGNKEWRTMAFIIDGSKFSIDLKYPDQIDPKEDISDRRPAIVKQHFGNLKIDYSRPKG